ncbi:MAG: single-stranded-DNA-specific exonuclease RecJ, partial [Pseudomonadota bacterium]|nr:single-stranded-DNA-specific exonuclease RecJ [Pseudomonadota bacterium]
MPALRPIEISSCDAFLGVEHSVTGRKWIARSYNERHALALAQRHGLPDLIARSLSARGVTLEEAPGFLEPKLRDALPDPSLLKDMDRAAARLAEAIQKSESMAVFGDYDVDGATSSALLVRFARAAGRDMRLYVPDRLREGYGPNIEAMQRLASEGIKLVICVDCGTTAHEPLRAAQAAGLDVIVLDHHASEALLPPACAIVNPNRLDEVNELGSLAAVGVTYLFVIAANRALRAAGWYAERAEPDLLAWLDLVALGTICDVVKLTGLNRALVAQGLRVMSAKRNAGIAALAYTTGIKGPMDAYTAGFIFGPRINAGGRVGEADSGARLLATADAALAAQLAQHLHELNAERRAIEARVLAEAEEITLTEKLPMAFVAKDNWHPGVIGIVAARLKDKFHHPAIVVALEGQVGKGSGRSIGNVDLGAAIIAARQAGLLVNGGGHKMAAGFTVMRDQLEALKDFLAKRIGKEIAAEPLLPTLTLDGLLASTSLQPEFVRKLEALGPFGTGNAEPRFALADCRIVRANIVGEKHVSVIVMQGGVRLKG